MTEEFYKRYQNYSQDELFKIVLAPDDFQAEAVAAAKKVINEKKWTDDLNRRIEEVNKKQIQDEALYEEEIKEKAAYYKSVVDFKKEDNSFQIRFTDIPKLETELVNHGIEFITEDKHIGVQLDDYPTQTYYFRTKDTAKVDEIIKSLGLITAPYTDYKPFFRFEIIVLLIAIGLTILFFVFI